MLIIPLLILQRPKATAYHPERPFCILSRARTTLKQNSGTNFKSQNSNTNQFHPR